jgi:hypothetical protein
MRCMFCGAEMRLTRVERATSMEVAGYAHHTFECPDCGEVERRLTFGSEAVTQPVEQMTPGNVQSAELTGTQLTEEVVSSPTWTATQGPLSSQSDGVENTFLPARIPEGVEQWGGLVPPAAVPVAASNSFVPRNNSLKLIYFEKPERSNRGSSTGFWARLLTGLQRRLRTEDE